MTNTPLRKYKRIKNAKDDFDSFWLSLGIEPRLVRDILLNQGRLMPHNSDMFSKQERGVQLMRR